MKPFYKLWIAVIFYGVTYTISHAADIQFPNNDIDYPNKIAIKYTLHVFHEYDSTCSPDQSHTPYFSLMTITHEWDQGFIRSLKKNWTFQNIIGETGLHQLNILWSSLMGTLAYHPEKNILVIAYRGSRQKSDYINNFNPGRGSLENANTQFALHAGYAHAFEHSKNSLLPSLNTILTGLSEDRIKSLKIICTGHSLGGATATVAAYFLADQFTFNGKKLPNIQLRVFGPPPVGNSDFNVWMCQNLSVTKTFYRETDILPSYLPSCHGLCTTGKLISLPSYNTGDQVYFHPMAHDVRKYMRGIYEALGKAPPHSFDITISLPFNATVTV